MYIGDALAEAIGLPLTWEPTSGSIILWTWCPIESTMTVPEEVLMAKVANALIEDVKVKRLTCADALDVPRQPWVDSGSAAVSLRRP